MTALNELLKEIQTKFNVVDLLNDLENDHDAFLALVQEFVLKNTQLDGISDEQKSMMHKIMTGIVYLLAALETNYAALNGIEPALNKGLVIEFKSQIPIGAGLGSSAAFGVSHQFTYFQTQIQKKKHAIIPYIFICTGLCCNNILYLFIDTFPTEFCKNIH